MTFEKQTAVFGRVFLHSVFKALKLFADNIQLAITPTQFRGHLTIQVNDPKFHGVEGTQPSVARFHNLANELYYKGMLVANTAGTKKSFDRLPAARINLANEDAVKCFLSNSIEFLRDQVGYYIDSHFDEDENVEAAVRKNQRNLKQS